MKLCDERPCGIYWKGSLITNTWNDHFHDGSTDVHLYEVIDDIVMLKNYSASIKDLTETEGKIERVRYNWYSCDISDHPDPRKRLGLEFYITKKIGDGYGGGRVVTYDKAVCEDIIKYIRKSLGIKNHAIKAALGKKVMMFTDERKNKWHFVGVRYSQ